MVQASYSQIFVSHGRDCGLNLKARGVMRSLEEGKVGAIYWFGHLLQCVKFQGDWLSVPGNHSGEWYADIT